MAINLGDIFGGLSQGFDTFYALKQALAEQQFQRQRLGVEDADRRDRINREWKTEQREQAAQDYDQRRDKQGDFLQAFKDAGIVGATPGLMDASRDSNQAQAGTGAGMGGEQALQTALRSLSLAQSQSSFDPRKQADLGGGLAYQGPEMGRSEPRPARRYVQNANDEWVLLEDDNSLPTRVQGRAPIGMNPNNPRNLQYVQDRYGNGYVLNKTTNNMDPIVLPGASPGQPGEQPVTPPGTPPRETPKPFIGTSGKPLADEMAGDRLVLSIGPAVERVEGYYKGHGAPGLAAQAAQDVAHGKGLLSGPANAVVGFLDPGFQRVMPDLTSVYRAFVYITTGKQINEAEAVDNVIQYVPRGGDKPETVQRKIQKINEMTTAVRQSTRRAADFRENMPGNQPPVSAPDAKGYYDSLRAQGKSADEALQLTDQKYPR